MEFRKPPVPPWRQVHGSFWSLGSLHPSISIDLASLWELGYWSKCEARPTALRTLGSNQEAAVVQSLLDAGGGGVKRCLCSPLAQGWSFIILLGTWEECQQSSQGPEAWECSYRTEAFHIIEAGSEEALSLPPSLDTNTPILLHSPGSWLSQPERWASVPVMSCVTAAKYQGLSAASFCKMILLSTVSLDNKCQEHNISC